MTFLTNVFHWPPRPQKHTSTYNYARLLKLQHFRNAKKKKKKISLSASNYQSSLGNEPVCVIHTHKQMRNMTHFNNRPQTQPNKTTKQNPQEPKKAKVKKRAWRGEGVEMWPDRSEGCTEETRKKKKEEKKPLGVVGWGVGKRKGAEGRPWWKTNGDLPIKSDTLVPTASHSQVGKVGGRCT